MVFFQGTLGLWVVGRSHYMFNAQLMHCLLENPRCETGTLVRLNFFRHAKFCEELRFSLRILFFFENRSADCFKYSVTDHLDRTFRKKKPIKHSSKLNTDGTPSLLGAIETMRLEHGKIFLINTDGNTLAIGCHVFLQTSLWRVLKVFNVQRLRARCHLGFHAIHIWYIYLFYLRKQCVWNTAKHSSKLNTDGTPSLLLAMGTVCLKHGKTFLKVKYRRNTFAIACHGNSVSKTRQKVRI